ncbi:MAG: hypothetical protein KGL53_02440, partial [Elusimicrobia bacterium]|nr:hypothetical protein [Elusimicrobiota bacterium]
DGRLRVQARPGTWVLTLTARHDGPAAALALAPAGGPWADEEVWTFQAREGLRSVTVEGVPAVDPQQTELPPQWRSLPAYLMKPGSTMRLAERRRGDADPDPDRLVLQRKLWLDFDGGGYTVQDTLTGSLSRSWRLAMGPGTELGRAAVDGQDRFITALTTGGPAGVELRSGTLQLTADSRMPRRFSEPAVGWAHDFERVSGTLNLPPGWRLVHAWGVDRASPSWVTQWTLLDLFLVTILALAVGRLWGRRWGWTALAAAALTWHEPGALRWCLLWALAGTALARGLPEGGLRRAAQALRWTALGLGVLWAIPFLVTQVRGGFFPQLERPGSGWSPLGYFAMGSLASSEMASQAAVQTVGGEPEAAPEPEAESLDAAEAPRGALKALNGMAAAGKMEYLMARSRRHASAPSYVPNRQMLLHDPNERVSTGPGLPSWNWRSVSLVWRGPVGADQRLRLWLLSPRENLALALARAALVVVLLLLLMDLPVGEWLSALRRPGGPASALRWLFPVLLLMTVAPPARAQSGFPPQQLLNDLTSRLTAAPDCAPQCADSPRLKLEAGPSSLRGRLEVDAGAAVAVPLPGGARSWTPSTVAVDGVPAAGLRRSSDGTLWLPLSAGAHQVSFEGPLPDAETVSLPLPLTPRRVEASAQGWEWHGVREDGRPEGSLELVRRRGAKGPAAALQAGALPPFVRVERTLELGLSWQVFTRVVRLTPTGTPVSLEVPLLPGESVTSDVQVRRGKALVTLAPQATEASWTATLKPADVLTLTAPPAASWVEDWRLDAGPIWHVEA